MSAGPQARDSESLSEPRSDDANGSIDACLGVLLVGLVGVAVPHQWGLLNLQPHPLWLIVLAIAIRYGTPASYFAGGLSATVYALLLWTRPEERFQPLGQADLVQPFLLAAGGIVFGELANWRRVRVASLEARLSDADRLLKDLTGRYETMLQVKEELEQRILTQPTSVLALCEAARQIGRLRSAEEVCAALVDLLTKHLQVEACSAYLRTETGELRLCAAYPQGEDHRCESLDECSAPGLLGKALRERKVVTVRDCLPLHALTTASQPEPTLMAGPLLSTDGRLFGLVSVEALPLLKITPTTARLLALALDWASAAIQAAAPQVEEQPAAEMASPDQILACLDDSLRRAKLRRQPLSIVAIRVENVGPLPAPAAQVALRRLAWQVRTHLRASDLVGGHLDLGALVLILPSTSEDGAWSVVARLVGLAPVYQASEIDESHLCFSDFGVASFQPGRDDAVLTDSRWLLQRATARLS